VAKVGDFGLSRPIEKAEQQGVTQTGIVMATPAFASPEQLLGDALDVRSDLYGVGGVLYYS
jgi:serine/threonine protein kinase